MLILTLMLVNLEPFSVFFFSKELPNCYDLIVVIESLRSLGAFLFMSDFFLVISFDIARQSEHNDLYMLWVIILTFSRNLKVLKILFITTLYYLRLKYYL